MDSGKLSFSFICITSYFQHCKNEWFWIFIIDFVLYVIKMLNGILA
jgi:hypothetical protein